MAASDGTEFPPLWPPGFHATTVEEIQVRCVDEFDLSKKREGLMDAFRVVLGCLVAVEISCEIWLDGSFITAQIEPRDIDFIAVVDSRLYDNGSEELRAVLDALIDGKWLGDPMYCDTNVAYVDPPEYAAAYNVLSYWERRFGFSKSNQTPKGIVTIKIVPPQKKETKATDKAEISKGAEGSSI